jgi:hypothetical protein
MTLGAGARPTGQLRRLEPTENEVKSLRLQFGTQRSTASKSVDQKLEPFHALNKLLLLLLLLYLLNNDP